MPLIDGEDLRCEFGAEVDQLATRCEQTDGCDVLMSVLNQANARVALALSAAGVCIPPRMAGVPLYPGPVFPAVTASIPGNLIPGSSAHTFYWWYRSAVAAVARFMLFRDARRMTEANPAFLAAYEGVMALLADPKRLRAMFYGLDFCGVQGGSRLAVGAQPGCNLPLPNFNCGPTHAC